ncbi:MAG TPA: ABC transporter ATP-binding protein [Pseudonocardia sp.]|nr:ABC transporter ATP-binding protein [Pseudonocardia sp.]
MSAPVVRMSEVTKRYRTVTALDGVSVELAPGAIHGLLGRNGAGKTTTMQILTGQVLATRGTVEVFGEHPYENAGVLSRVCFVKESQAYPYMFRVAHVLRAAAQLQPSWDAAFAAELLADFGLPADRLVRQLSRGMRSALGVVIGLASRAPLTLFDEPCSGLDASARQLFYDRLLADYAEHPRTVVLSTHLIDEVSDLIEHVVVIDDGRVVIDAGADALRTEAVSVTGPAAAVEAVVAGHAELHREQLAGRLRVTVTGAAALPPSDGLQVEPVSLQELVVRSTRRGGQPVTPGAGTGGAR